MLKLHPTDPLTILEPQNPSQLYILNSQLAAIEIMKWSGKLAAEI